MIDVIIADDQEIFRVGMTGILAVNRDVRVVGQPESAEQLLSALKTLVPHVLVLSTSFLPAFHKVRRVLKRRQTALVVLAEDNDQVAYGRWLRAQAVVHRSMAGPVIVDAMRRVARGELFAQDASSDLRKEQAAVSAERTRFTVRLRAKPPQI